jgi:hypothetical protein
MTKYIATRLHKARELAPDEPFFQRCAKLPHYVIDMSLIELLARSDVQQSVTAMVEAEIAHLPFEELCIEMQASPEVRHYVIMAETGGAFRAQVGATYGEEAAEVAPAAYDLEITDATIRARTSVPSHEAWMYVSAMALGVCLLMLNIQGVEKEVIEATKLNRSRNASGKPTISNHTVMRIGHVYGSNGERLGFGSGKMMAVHMRAGHARRQHYGEGNSLVKFVYIPPVLVNFKPGVEPVVPKRVLAA